MGITDVQPACHFIDTYEDGVVVNAELAIAFASLVTRVIGEDEENAKSMGRFFPLLMDVLRSLGEEKQVTRTCFEAIVALLRCLDTQEFLRIQQCDLVVRMAELHGIGGGDGDVAEGGLNVICMCCIANAMGKDMMGRAGACELSAKLLRRHVSLTAAHNGVATMYAYAVAALKQPNTLENKERLDAVGTVGLLNR
ncbi:hypothetical protein B484DRAFT_412442 [Ochromonadaceae sp. CCMP2298]|nr:hypothetical protein B484DRAFT_412442 [Ochromonadaceae sp. CCMP2298]